MEEQFEDKFYTLTIRVKVDKQAFIDEYDKLKKENDEWQEKYQEDWYEDILEATIENIEEEIKGDFDIHSPLGNITSRIIDLEADNAR